MLPTKIFNNIYEITPEYLASLGIKALILDIDNTLVTYDDPKPTEPVLDWLCGMNKAGIKTAFVSNNHKQRVEEFCLELDSYWHADAGKPSRKFLYEAMNYMNVSPSECASVGDQVFTDVWAAKRAKITAFLVPPIKDKKTLFFRVKRFFEKPIIKTYLKKTQNGEINDKVL